MRSKLKSTLYSVANPSKWLSSGWEDLDPIFAGRLANLAESKGVAIKITAGYRSSEKQAELYKQYLNYKKTGKGSVKLAARPGTSFHEFRLAIDTSTKPFRQMDNEQLKPYGLCKPIKAEGWHIQPIETMGQRDPKNWAPIEDDVVRHEDIQALRNIGLNEVSILFMLEHPYSGSLFLKIAAGLRKKGAIGGDIECLRWAGLSDSTINWLLEYKYGAKLVSIIAENLRG